MNIQPEKKTNIYLVIEFGNITSNNYKSVEMALKIFKFCSDKFFKDTKGSIPKKNSKCKLFPNWP